MKLSHLLRSLVFVALLCVSKSYAAGELILDLGQKVTLEVARDNQERAKGLSLRDSVPLGTGMVFIKPGLQQSSACFWMRDTYVPLDIAFVDKEGTIMRIYTMLPRLPLEYCPPRPATWVIEVPANWFENQGYSSGMSVGAENLAKLGNLN